MAPTQVYLIPSPIGDRLSDFSFAGMRALDKLEHLFFEAEDEFYGRMCRKDLIGARHQITFLSDPERAVERAVELVAAETPFGIIASGGLPCFVDPGWEIVDRLLQQHLEEVELVPVGMSSALDAALAMTGRDLHQFLFLGHVPELYTLNQQLVDHRLPLVYFVRGPSLRALFSQLGKLQGPWERILLFKDIRKRSRFALTLLREPTLPDHVAVGDQADYVLVIVPVEQRHLER